MFIVDVEAKNSIKGRKCLFYLRDSNTSTTYECEKDDILVSNRLSLGEAQDFAERLEEYSPKIMASGGRYVVMVRGPRELKHDSEFKKKLIYQMDSQPEVSLRLNYPPFTKAEIENGEMKIVGKADINSLQKETACCLDIEVEDPEIDPKTYLVSVVSDKGDIIFTTKNPGLSEVCLDSRRANVIVCSEDEIVEHVAQFINEIDPLYIFGHNIMDFDLPYLADAGRFYIGVDGSKPKIKGGIPGYSKKRIVKGRYVIDTLSFARNNLWLPDNKLETVANCLDIQFKKEYDYEKLNELAKKASTDKSIATDLARYNYNDALVTYQIGKRFLPIILGASLDFFTDPTTVCFRSSPVSEYYDNVYFHELHTFRQERNIEFDVEEKKRKLLKFPSKIGTYKILAIYVPLFEEALKFSKEFSHLYEMLETENITDKIITSRVIEKAGEEILYDLYSDVPENIFFGRYSVNKRVVEDAIISRVHEYKNLLSEFNVINNAGIFLFLEDNGKHPKDVIVYGNGDAISVEDGRLITRINGKIISPGIDIHGTRSKRTNFERELFSTAIQTILIDKNPKELSKFLEMKFSKLINGEIKREDLLYYVKAGLDYQSYSHRAQKREGVEFIIERKMRKGEEQEYGYSFVNGKLKKLPKEDFLNSKPAINYYVEKFFGKDGSLTELLNAIPEILPPVDRRLPHQLKLF
ncbi:MAG: 3'-5' exonuclease [Candidatus Aenigmarchaeota archaeon]|nr:3'-5' exonuclease [Candidatus Aenigmarchaeota archaeon]